MGLNNWESPVAKILKGIFLKNKRGILEGVPVVNENILQIIWKDSAIKEVSLGTYHSYLP